MRIGLTPEKHGNQPLKTIIENLPTLCETSGQRIKHDARGEVFQLRSQGWTLAVKRFFPLTMPLKRLPRRLLKGRTAPSVWHRSREAYGRGIPLAQPLGFNQPGSAMGEGFIAFEWREGTPVAEWLTQPGRPNAEQRECIFKLATIVAHMHAAAVSHGDLKPRNILVCRGDIVLIDPDAIRIHRFRAGLAKRIRRDLKTITEGLASAGVSQGLLSQFEEHVWCEQR